MAVNGIQNGGNMTPLDKNIGFDQFLAKKASAEPEPTLIEGQPLLTGDALKKFVSEHKRLQPPAIDNMFNGAIHAGDVPVAYWGGIIFTVRKSDIEAGRTTVAEGAKAAQQILQDADKTQAGSFILQKMDKKFEGKKFHRFSLDAGIPQGSGDRIPNDEKLVINGHADQATLKHKDKSQHSGGHGGHHNIPFQYARYMYDEDKNWNKDPEKKPVAASPSDVFIHECGHVIGDSFKNVEQFHQTVRENGGFVDSNLNGINDIEESRKAFQDAPHQGIKRGAGSVYFEKAHITEKAEYDPRSGDNLMGSKQYTIGVRTYNAAGIPERTETPPAK